MTEFQFETGIPLCEENLEEIHRRLKGTPGERTIGQLRTRLEFDGRVAKMLKDPDYRSFVWVSREEPADGNQEQRNLDYKKE